MKSANAGSPQPLAWSARSTRAIATPYSRSTCRCIPANCQSRRHDFNGTIATRAMIASANLSRPQHRVKGTP